MTSQANHVTQNVARTKLAQYLTLVNVSSNSIGWLMRKSTNKLGGKKNKNKLDLIRHWDKLGDPNFRLSQGKDKFETKKGRKKEMKVERTKI